MPENTRTYITSTEFGLLFQQYKPRFVLVARSYVRDAMVAEDLVVDSFVTFWENRDKIEITQNIPAYILATVKRRCLNWLRDQNIHLRIQEEIHATSLRILASRMETLETNNPDALFYGEVSAIIKCEIENMPERMRKVFLANRFGEMTYREIGEKYGLSFNQVNFEIRKATQILRQALVDYLPLFLVLFNLPGAF